MHGLGTEAARQGDTRVEVTLGHANAGGRRMQACFGLADVRAALCQLRRQANRNLALGLGHCAVRRQLRMQGLRRLAHQQAQGVDQLVLALLQIRQSRFDGGHLRSGFSDIQVGRHAIGQTQLREFQATARHVEVLLGDRTGALHAAQLDVVLGGLGQHRQEYAAAVVFGHLQGGVGSFGFAPYPAPEIQLPGSGKTGVPQVEGRTAVVAGRVAQAIGAVAFAAVVAIGADLWIAPGGRHLAHRTALLQAAAGQFQVEVVAQCPAHQGRQLPVVEHVPPLFFQRVADRAAGGLAALGLGPLHRRLGVGPLKVRADGASAQADHAHSKQREFSHCFATSRCCALGWVLTLASTDIPTRRR